MFALKESNCLVRVLRLVDGEKKPPVKYIYEAMDRAKEAIAKSFDGKEEKDRHFHNNSFDGKEEKDRHFHNN